jgi:hypothetical protein
MSTKKCCPKLKKMNLSLFKTRWHLGRRASKNVNKHVPWSPNDSINDLKMSGTEVGLEPGAFLPVAVAMTTNSLIQFL